MRVAIDLQTMSACRTSFDSYMETLVDQLEKIDRKHTYLRLPAPSKYDLPLASRLWRDQVLVPRIAKQLDVAILHQSTFSVPAGFSKPVVATIHEVVDADYYHRWRAYSYRQFAEQIIVLSDYAKRYAVEELRIPEQRLTVLQGAVSDHFRPLASPDLLAGVRRSYGMGERYIACLTAGNDSSLPRQFCITLFAEIRRKVRARWKLVLVDQSKTSQVQSRAQIESLGLTNDVVFASCSTEQERSAIYSAAALVVFPQNADLTGLTLIEAMSCGVPVVCSTGGSFPELIGIRGMQLPTTNLQDWVKAIISLITDAALRREQAGRSQKQARRFSWQRTALETIRVYESVLRSYKRQQR